MEKEEEEEEVERQKSLPMEEGARQPTEYGVALIMEHGEALMMEEVVDSLLAVLEALEHLFPEARFARCVLKIQIRLDVALLSFCRVTNGPTSAALVLASYSWLLPETTC